MVKVGGLFRIFVLRTLLILFTTGVAGEGLLAHAGMSGRTACSVKDHSAMAMPMDHSALNDGTSETEQAICAITCMAVASVLPLAPVVLVPVGVAQIPRLSGLLLPAPVVSDPDRPPPKRPFV